ncbi:annexin A2 isoform X2 [Salmo salar]|uniref:Annexin A2 isoform X2 n=1 Tax=Salmo salar TaxID=8030 RepID=A0A1S3PZC9_SALSA|nr:annexin A2 isoform X2 [Salmo salar]|eukprot:XP_014033063.1 PREDICTED: annexin A2-like isoform X2 [Salmo salar]
MDIEYLPSFEMAWGTLGTIRPFLNFHAKRDALNIQAALEQKDVLTLINILTNRSNAQRQIIAQTFKTITEKELSSGLKKALSGELENLLLALLMTPLQFEAYRLRQSMEGIGTDEEGLLEILCTRSPKVLANITATYKEQYNKDLETDLKGETSGDFAKLVLALLKKKKVVGLVQRDTEALSEAINQAKADPGPWITILTTRDSEHLNKVFVNLESEKQETVDEAIEKAFSGDVRLGLKTLVRCVQSPNLYLAQRLETMKAAIVQGVMVSHSEKDLLCVRVAYLRQTGTSLYTALQGAFPSPGWPFGKFWAELEYTHFSRHHYTTVCTHPPDVMHI